MRVLIAMSGGVDSTVAATAILDAGYEAAGCTLRLCDGCGERPSGSEEDLSRAAALAARLGIPHTVLDLSQEFSEEVVRPFCLEYLAGRTPNPCIECNRTMKFGRLCDYADRMGFDKVATGHYARIVLEEGHYRLKKAADPKKDQSYVLYHLTEERLARLCFPLGELTKTDVRRLAALRGLGDVASVGESQDICFVPDGRYAELIERVTGRRAPEGNYVDADGRVLGRHRGITHYTIGQHKGLGIALGRVRYVTAISAERAEVTLGDSEELFRREVHVGHLHYIGTRPTAEHRAAVKLRYRQTEQPATVYPEGMGARIVFDEPQRAPAPGQSAVLYDGDTVLGGGVIS